jgi:hypothetical protein
MFQPSGRYVSDRLRPEHIWSLDLRAVCTTNHCLHFVTAIQLPLCSPPFTILGTIIDIPSSQLSVKDRELANLLQLLTISQKV